MPFASTTLAARIERAECDLLEKGAVAAAERLPDADVFVHPVAGGLATFTVPGSPLNKLAGLGFGGPLGEGELEEVERAFEERGAALQVELASLGDPSVGALLTGRGYVLQNFENVSGRALPWSDAPETNPAISVREDDADGLAAWTDVVVTGFAHPDVEGVPSHESYPRDVIEEAIVDLARSKGFLRYVARIDDRIAGGASMRLRDGVAQLCGATTLPELRRRGVQTALLVQRLDAASRAGCDVAVVVTQPGSKSQENARRQGFELLYTRAILVRTP
jgi:GNAT superfamily N-acetyltransferase